MWSYWWSIRVIGQLAAALLCPPIGVYAAPFEGRRTMTEQWIIDLIAIKDTAIRALQSGVDGWRDRPQARRRRARPVELKGQ